MPSKRLTVLGKQSALNLGEAKRPELERQLTQARRAVEKAIGVLSRLD